jgi:2-dehydro-3-deoxyphosphogluconate aldolase/(4S)-4-hydroxy-2-oxoglutarate aldolase
MEYLMNPRPAVPAGVILVIRTDDRRLALAAARGAAMGGIDAVEITLTVPDAVGVIRELSGLGVPVGVGTVLAPAQVAPAVAAGASFVVAPGTDAAVITAAHEAGVPMVAGGLTPTEVQTAHALGSDAVKIFPAGSVGGPRYLGELRGPLPHIPYVISGGVSIETAAEYFAAGAHAVCVGRSMFSNDLLTSGDLDALADEARAFMAGAGRA